MSLLLMVQKYCRIELKLKGEHHIRHFMADVFFSWLCKPHFLYPSNLKINTDLQAGLDFA